MTTTDNVIYDLTFEARARSTPIERPQSRSVAVQTTLVKKTCTKKHHKTNKISSENIETHQYQPAPRMLTVETIYTGNDIPSDLYMDPQDARKTPPPELPARPAFHSQNPPPPQVPPKSANLKTKTVPKKPKKSVSIKKNPNFLIQPCLNVNQRRVVKYNLLLSMTINVLVMALGGTGFVSIISRQDKEENSYKYVLIASSFSVCYALLSVTTDALAMLALQRRNRELLLPWLIWYILDMAIYVSVMVLVITFLVNYMILLVVFKIIWTLFVWVNIRDLYTTGKIYGHLKRKKVKSGSDILY